jgi:hypothetical protein
MSVILVAKPEAASLQPAPLRICMRTTKLSSPKTRSSPTIAACFGQLRSYCSFHWARAVPRAGPLIRILIAQDRSLRRSTWRHQSPQAGDPFSDHWGGYANCRTSCPRDVSVCVKFSGNGHTLPRSALANANALNSLRYSAANAGAWPVSTMPGLSASFSVAGKLFLGSRPKNRA